MTATDKPSVIADFQAFLEKRIKQYDDLSTRAAGAVNDVLYEYREKYVKRLEADKQAYAAQQVSAALEKVRAKHKATFYAYGSEEFRLLAEEEAILADVDDVLSESLEETQKR